jgi:hypothetical protein
MASAESHVSIEPTLRFLFGARVSVGPATEVGQTPHGLRRIIPILSGTFSGPRLSGKVLGGGADWQVVRPDGVAEIEARYTLETDDGALIYVRNPGIRAASKEVTDRLVRGEKCDPSEYYFRTRPVFETGAPQYQWLHRIIAVCAGERLPDQVILSFYELT